MIGQSVRKMNLFWLALSFLTTLPSKQIPYVPGGLGKSAAFFPLIGLLIGSVVFAIAWIMSFVLPNLIAGIIVLLAWVLLTGGLHLDGLADCCDGLFGSVTAEKRLEILKDPRSGSFALIGLIIALTLKVSLIFVVLENSSLQQYWLPFLLSPTLARLLILPTAIQPQARSSGMGADFATTISPKIISIASILPIILLLAGWQQPINILIGAGLAVITTSVWIVLARTRIGGVTGDVYGAVVETAEISVLLGFALIA